MDAANSEVMTACASIFATTATLTGLFFKRIQQSENKLHDAIDDVNKKLNRIDKNLAVNTAFIEQILKQKER